MHYFLQVYAGIGILNSFIVILRAFFFAYGGIKAAKIVHKNLLRSITKVMRFISIFKKIKKLVLCLKSCGPSTAGEFCKINLNFEEKHVFIHTFFFRKILVNDLSLY